jgi:hygromycin-B 7''-O-kinase
MHPLSALNDLNAYRRLFTDADFWTPYVQKACRRHGLDCETVRVGMPGTCPVFLVDRRWIVKFFGRLFDGARSFAAEREAGRLVEIDPAIRTARLVASGELGESDWPWPYLIFEHIRGASIGEVWDRVSFGDRQRAAREMGDTVRRIHALPLEGSPVFPNSYESYLRFLEQQRAGVVERQRRWGHLPGHLVDQIDAFLPSLDELVDRRHPPHLIHADLTRDHLLGQLEGGRWTSLAVIDFGDARTGDLLYELSALHLDLFHGEKRLLAAFLDSYGISPTQHAGLPCKALATALLHQFDVFAGIPTSGLQAGTLAGLADLLWDTSSTSTPSITCAGVISSNKGT